MAAVTKLEGVGPFMAALKKEHTKLGKGVANGLKLGGLLIQREAQLRTPVDKSVLKPNATTTAQGEGWDCEVMVGYPTWYAVYVHEILHYKHDVGEAMFLENAISAKIKEVYEIVRMEADKAWK